MKMSFALVLAAGLIAAASSALAQSIGTAFTYQADLVQNGAPAGSVDLRFRLYDAATGGTRIGPELAALAITPEDGKFTVSLDFGAGAFAGAARYLEIDAATAAGGAGPYVTLAPRQRVNPTPYALFASSVAPTAVPWIFSGANATFVGGNVGDGTTSPTAKLHIVGTAVNGQSLNANDKLYVTSAFVGVNRSSVVSGAEFFGIQAPVVGNSYGGMYIRTDSATGKPFYGYANTGGATMWTYLNGADNSWRVYNGGDRLTITSTGNVGIGTITPATPFELGLGDKKLQFRFDSGLVPGLNLSGTGGNLGILRLRNKLEVWPDDAGLAAGSIDIRNLAGSPTLSLDGSTGNFAMNGALTVDAAGAGDGTLSTPSIRLGAGSGEGMASRRIAGTNQWGLELLTFFTPRLSITNVGNVGIGTQTPAALLDVAGALRVGGQAAFANGSGAPFTVANATKVNGLNADLLDGLDSTNFLTSVPNPLGLTSSTAGGNVIRGTNTSTSANSVGVAGITTSTSTNILNPVFGVYGETAAAGLSAAIFGKNTRTGNTSGTAIYGLGTADYGRGVYGLATSSAAGGGAIGVMGESSSPGGQGVYGEHNGGGDGVYGYSDSGVGVRAYTSSGGIALYGERLANGNKGWLGGLNEGGWAESSTGNGMVAISGSAAASGLYCHNSAGGNALFADGVATVRVLTIIGGADLAEPFDVGSGTAVPAVSGEASTATEPAPGLVVSIDPANPGKLRVSNAAYDRKVAGIISGANGLSPGMVMRAENTPQADGAHAVAMTGRVWCFVDASFGAIEPGDRLTTSPTPGHAMKAVDDGKSIGAVIGKAMTPLREGDKGLVLVLVNLQ